MEDEIIRMTHFVNPHLFFYKPVSAYMRNSEEKRFQIEVDEYCEQHFRPTGAQESVQYDAFQGEIVAVMDFDRNKWRRCVVDEIVEDGTRERLYSLWAIDDGVPIQAFSRDVVPLPKNLSSETTVKVKRGAIKNILPSERVYDCDEDELVSRVTNKWDQSAVDVLQSVIQSADSIHFRNVTKHKVSSSSVLTYFGDLEIVTRKGNRFSAVRVLEDICRATATEPREFLSRLSQIQTLNDNRCRTHTEIDHSKRLTKHVVKTKSSESVAKRDNHKPPNILEINDVSEQDFDESASMVRPSSVHQKSYKPYVPAKVYSDEELYPTSFDRVMNDRNGNHELKLWEQQTRLPSRETIAKVEHLKQNGHHHLEKLNDKSSITDSKLNDSTDKPKSTSSRNKLEMLKKLRAASKPQVEPERKSPPPAAQSRYSGINIFPAGFQMGNVCFNNGRMVAGGGDSSDTARKNKNISPNFKLRQTTTKNVPKSASPKQQVAKLERDTRYSSGGGSSGAEGDNGAKVYMTKNTSRFDQFVEEEAW